MKLIDIVSNITLFKGLSETHLEKLSDILIDQTFNRSVTIFSEGDEAEGFYAVISGRVKIFKISSDGKEQIIHIFGPGNIFGEVPMFAGGRFPANAEAIEKSRVFFFPRIAFIELIKREPYLAMNMLAELSKKLRQLTRLIEDLSLKEVPGRLATYLLLLNEKVGDYNVIELDITKTQLAGLLGTIPETLSRILGRMASQGIIEVNGRTVTILNRQALQEISEGGRSFF